VGGLAHGRDIGANVGAACAGIQGGAAGGAESCPFCRDPNGRSLSLAMWRRPLGEQAADLARLMRDIRGAAAGAGAS